MKKIFLIIFSFYQFTYAQYQVKCDYLSNPELIKGYVDSCAKFWFPSYDTTFGGFYSNVPRNGIVTNTSSKNMLTQSRTAYGMIKAFMLSGDTTYLKYARGALDFMYEHAWDNANGGGWYNELDREGDIIPNGDHNSDKWSFMQHYALLGIAAMVEANQTETDWEYLLNGRNAVDNFLWDTRNGYEGYYNTADEDWSNPNGKGFTPTMDGITTHALSMYLITGKEEYKERLTAMADNVIDYLLPAMDHFEYGYPEEYNSNWEPLVNNTYVFTGHLLKSAWCLTRAYLIEPKEEYLDFSSTILEEVLEQGYDHEYGGCYKEYNGATGTRYDNNKEWWELEQAFTAAIMNYYISGDERFLEMADETLDFYMKYFVDHQYGEVYQTTTRTGSPTTTSKASYWKAGYHSIELGYYIYLYGNLYLHNKPVTLYYNFQPVDSSRKISLYPLAIENEKLIIKNILLNNVAYKNFDPELREINIPADTGGIFAVTFERTPSVGNINSSDLVMDFKLNQNYPNPFNPETTLEYEVNDNGNVTLEIYDITGRKIKTLVNDYKTRGSYKVKWNGKNSNEVKVSSGVYFFQLQFNNQRQVKKGIMLN